MCYMLCVRAGPPGRALLIRVLCVLCVPVRACIIRVLGSVRAFCFCRIVRADRGPRYEARCTSKSWPWMGAYYDGLHMSYAVQRCTLYAQRLAFCVRPRQGGTWSVGCRSIGTPARQGGAVYARYATHDRESGPHLLETSTRVAGSDPVLYVLIVASYAGRACRRARACFCLER
ncbi:hypothetical protein C8Q79DRAFT_520500 [Trametes meyenii]|nr:hypothetical protein C8Q79DRAFT_520500 [Trametes meyenii]